MGSTKIGIDIGSRRLKLVSQERCVSAEMQQDFIREGRVLSYDALGEFLGEVLREQKLRAKKAVLVLPEGAAVLRQISMPMMEEKHLRLNLPYEFADFLNEDKESYNFDFVVLGTEEDAEGKETIRLLAAAVNRELIHHFAEMCRTAGLRLEGAIPYAMSFSNLLLSKPEGEHCFIDLGHSACRITIFRDRELAATRVIEYGCQMLDTVIAEELEVDVHLAATYKETNYQNCLDSEGCRNLYHGVAVEVMRAINFYRFNHPESTLEKAYLCGGGTKISPLVEALREYVGLSLHSMDEVVTDMDDGDAALFANAAGAIEQ